MSAAAWYSVRSQDPVASRELASACGIGPAVAQVLLHRGYREVDAAREFLGAKLAGLTPPDAMADRDVAATRLADAVTRRERIAVFGDYDVDGITSAVVLAGILRDAGADVVTLVASRFAGGYGFSNEALARCREARARLIVTCDCGSSDHERIAVARAQGLDVIVVDHHLVPAEPLPALAFLNPHRSDCGYPYKGLASAGLALVLGAAVRQKLGTRQDLRAWLDLVALGTIADIAPLDGDNRRLVRAGLVRLVAPDARPGIAALRQLAGVRGNVLGAIDVAFRLTPRLNAAGRTGDPGAAVALLEARTLEDARAYAAKLDLMNQERKRLTALATEQAVAQVREIYGAGPTSGVVAASESWNRGVVGIVAARLVEELGVPAIVIALDGGLGHGSARAPRGFALHDAVAHCRGVLEGFGGHHAAAGLTVRAERIDALRGEFADASRGFAGRAEAAMAPTEVDAELGDGAFAPPSAADLVLLEPLGEKNPEPLFGVPRARIERATLVTGGHLRATVRLGGIELGAFGYSLGDRVKDLRGEVALVAAVRRDGWRGEARVELRIAEFWAL